MQNKTFEIIIYGRGGLTTVNPITQDELNEFDKLTGVTKAKVGRGLFQAEMRYFQLRDLAWITLIESGAKALPINLYEIAEYNGLLMLSYQKQADILKMIDKDGTRFKCEGFSCDIAGRKIVCFDESPSPARVRWTTAHEFGHLLLRHINKAVKDYEKEANMFAARLLMPMCVLKECNATTAAQIAALCGTSIEASGYRAERLKMLLERGKFYTSDYEIRLLKQFEDFILKYNKQNK